MEWEEPHDSTLYCLQTDGNHLLATGSSYYGVVRLWDRRQRACLHVSAPLLGAGSGRGGAWRRWGSLRWARAAEVRAPPSVAGLPADLHPAQQPRVLPALHHQAPLCRALLQPPRPGLPEPVTGPPRPAGQGSQLLRDLYAWRVQGYLRPHRACAPRPVTTVLGHRQVKAADSWEFGGTPPQELIGEKGSAALREWLSLAGPCFPVGQSKDLVWTGLPCTSPLLRATIA